MITQPHASSPTCAGSIAATSVRSGACCTARQTSWPMRPPAPTTPTLTMGPRLSGGHGGQVRLEGVLVEGAHRAHRAWCLRHQGRDVEHLRAVDALNSREHLVDGEDLAVEEQRGTDAAHPGT